EKMLQLIYLYFTKPRKSYEAFNDWKRNRYNDYHNPSYGLVYADFDNAIKEIIGDSTLLFPSGTKHFKGLQRTDLEKGHKIYKKLFSNARDFTFLISGDFAIDSVLPIVQKYLGNLPNMEDSFKCIPKNLTGISFGKGPVFERIPVPDYGMRNVSYAIKYIEDLKKPFNWRDNIKIQLLGSITNDEAWKLRHDKGYALYNIIVYGRYSHEQSQYQINLKLDCEMKELTTIQNECNTIFSNIKLGHINDELDRKSTRLNSSHVKSS